MDASSQKGVIERLRDMGYTPIRAFEAGVAERGAAPARRASSGSMFRQGVSADEVGVLTQEIATLLGAGLPLDRSLEILVGLAENDRVAGVLTKVRNEVRGGASLSKALEAQGTVFSRFYVNMIRAGEAGGALADVLREAVGVHGALQGAAREREVRAHLPGDPGVRRRRRRWRSCSAWWCRSSSPSSRRAARRCRSSRSWCSAPARSCAATGGPSSSAASRWSSSSRAACARPRPSSRWDRVVLGLPVVGRPRGEGGDGAARAHARHAPSQRRVAGERAVDRARDDGQHLPGRRPRRRSAGS